MASRVSGIVGALIVIAVVVLSMASPTWAVTAGVDHDVLAGSSSSDGSGDADFGSGHHSGGIPGPYTVTWDYTPSNGVVLVTARVQGTLYLDRLFGGGCARLKINFQDIAFNNLFATQDIHFCGPGFDANNSANQKAVNVVSVADTRIRHVQLVIGSGNTTGSIIDDKATTETFPNVRTSDIINNGATDLGGPGPFPVHFNGSPVDPFSVKVELRDTNVIRGEVSGILFWDSTSAGSARAIIDFQNSNGANLATRTVNLTAPSGGNALASANQASFDQVFSSASLFKIRVRVGTVSGGSFVGVASRTYSLGPSVGEGLGVPFAVAAKVHDETVYGVQWTVPDPESWRSLATLDIRLVDEAGEILEVHWDQTANTFTAFDPHTGRTSPAVAPGSPVRFETPAVVLLLRDTAVVPSGPTEPTVLLNLALQFEPQAAGRTFNVEARALDDSGGVQGWDFVGSLTVSPQGNGHQH